MTRINSTVASGSILESAQVYEEQVKNHIAWQAYATELSSDSLLKQCPAFTYLLRPGDREHAFFISFIDADHTVHHHQFTFELDQGGWYYRNASIAGPEDHIQDLIPSMMHCSPEECLAFDRKSEAT